MVRVVGPTNERTGNLVVLENGLKSNVRCGADILLTGMYQDVRGEAVCPVCGAKTKVIVKDKRVVSVSHESALLHYVVEEQPRFSICCGYTFIFDRAGCLKTWLGSYKGKAGTISSLSDFMEEAISRRRGFK